MTALQRVGGSWAHPDDPGEPSTGKPRLSVTDQEAAILAARAAWLDVLEIGTGLGVSTRALASTARTVLTIDIDWWVHDNIWPHLPDNVTTAISVEPGAVFDVVFIDGDHATEAAQLDIELALLSITPNGFVLVHDANYLAVRQALPDTAEILPTEHGIAVIPARPPA